MIYRNPNSRRENYFRKVYDDPAFCGILSRKNQVPQFPFLIDVEITNHCNLKCIFCAHQLMQREKGFMADDIFFKVVNDCAAYGVPIRLIRWGEPFLHPRIIQYVEYAKAAGIGVHITNNGLVVRKAQIDELIRMELDSIIFSFQGTSPQAYALLRNNKGYDRVREMIRYLVKRRGEREKPYLHVSCTVTDETKDQIDEFVALWVNIVDSVGIGHTNLSRLSAEAIKDPGRRELVTCLKRGESIRKVHPPCTEIYQKLSVNYDGSVSCCCSDYDNFMVVGTLKEQTLEAIWNHSEELKMFRYLLDKERHCCLNLCSTCYQTYERFK